MVLTGAKKIDQNLFVIEIVSNDYRTADVFRRYGIDFSTGANWPLKMICEAKNLDVVKVKKELEDAIRTVHLPNTLKYEEWDIDFLTDYIVNIHHHYLRKALPEAKDYLEEFVDSHQEKLTYLPKLLALFLDLSTDIYPHLQQEETIIFPYIRQITHAYNNKESYAGLLVRTLRKPVENVMQHEHETFNRFLKQLRQLTDYYAVPAGACVSHKVAFSKLLEFDNDMVQHMHLENDILFPRAIALEKELLEKKDDR